MELPELSQVWAGKEQRDWEPTPESCWVAVKELNFLGNPSFTFKGSFKGDIDIDIDIDIDTWLSGLLLRSSII